MSDTEKLILKGILCGLEQGCWDKPCQKTKCVWNVNKSETMNCFLLYKYTINDKPHTLYEVANLLKVSHTTIKQVEDEAFQLLKDSDLSTSDI